MMNSRRSFLAVVGSAALGLALPSCRPTSASPPRRRLRRIGLQLYTLRSEMQRDLPGTLARVAEIGYQEVEFAGYFGRTPADIRALLEQNHLTAPSSHVGFPDLGDGWARTLDDAKAVGHTFVTVPWIAEEARRDADGYRRVADVFNRAARQARDKGLRFAYHNHDFEFRPTAGLVPFNILLEQTDPTLVDFEMDLYWVVKGGHDPVEYFDKYPRRFAMVHVKDATAAPERRMTDVGKGTIDFRRIFANDAEHGASIQHFFVEYDEPPDPMASVRVSHDYLAQLEY